MSKKPDHLFPETAIRFRAKIQIVGVNPFVTVPGRVSRHFGKRGYVRVVVHLERGQVASTLVPVGGGVHRLYINGLMLRCTESRVGDMVAVGLTLDTSDRSLKPPRRLMSELNASAVARSRWAAFSPSKRHEIVRYILSGKVVATQDRNIAKLLAVLKSKTGKGVLSGISISAPRALERTNKIS